MFDIVRISDYNTRMNEMIKKEIAESMASFSLPRYEELPTLGFFLEQTVDYINQVLQPLNGLQITGSMIRNYVKQGLIHNPVRKKYSTDQIAYLICITILKQVASLEDLSHLFIQQQKIYTSPVAYNYFCDEMENVLFYQLGLKDSLDSVGITSSLEKDILKSALIAVSNIIFINKCFDYLNHKEKD